MRSSGSIFANITSVIIGAGSPLSDFDTGIDLLKPMDQFYPAGDVKPLATAFRPTVIPVEYYGNPDWERKGSVRPIGSKARRGPKRLKPTKAEQKVAISYQKLVKETLNLYINDN